MKRAILVKSCQPFIARRDACERTWVSCLRTKQVPVWYVVAGQEQNPADISQGGWFCVDTGDAYTDNSFKLRAALRMLLAIADFDRLFVCDDDTFVHPSRWIAHEPIDDLECRLFYPDSGQRPWVHGGGGFWLSRRMCELYIEHCRERTSGDDVLVARIAQKQGIEIVDRPDLYAGDRYSGNADHRVAADNQFITCHHVQPDEMFRLYWATKTL